MRASVVLVLIACANSPAAPQRQAGSADSAAHVDPNVMQAPQLFAALCAHCHGAEAKGYRADQAPSLVNPMFLESADDSYLRSSIERGRPGTSMAAYGKALGGPLNPAAVDRLVSWLRSHGPAPRELPPVATGSATRGNALYVTHCLTCHGDRQRAGTYLMLTNARFLELATDRFLQHAIRFGRPGTPMLPFQQKLTEQNVADIVAYVRSFAQPVEIAPLPAPSGKEPLFVNPNGTPPRFKVKDGRFVAADDVKAALDAKRKMVIIDARPQSEWMTTHIAGAVSIPHYQMDRLAEIPKDAWIVAYCACPHHLSGLVVDELQKRGYPHAAVLDEGILEWQRRKYPTVTAPGALPPPEPPVPQADKAELKKKPTGMNKPRGSRVEL